MTKNAFDCPNELQAVDRARFRMRLWLALPIAALVIGVILVPLRAMIVPAIILFVVLAKGAVEYRKLGKHRDDLLDRPAL